MSCNANEFVRSEVRRAADKVFEEEARRLNRIAFGRTAGVVDCDVHEEGLMTTRNFTVAPSDVPVVVVDGETLDPSQVERRGNTVKITGVPARRIINVIYSHEPPNVLDAFPLAGTKPITGHAGDWKKREARRPHRRKRRG